MSIQKPHQWKRLGTKNHFTVVRLLCARTSRPAPERGRGLVPTKPRETAHLVAACGCYLADHGVSVSSPRYDGDDDTFVSYQKLTKDHNMALTFESRASAERSLKRRKGRTKAYVIHDNDCKSCVLGQELRVLS